MARKKKKSSLQERLNQTNVREETRYKEPEKPKGGSLPPGIEGGVAKLTRVDFNEFESGDNKGEQRLYLHGRCIQPKTFTDAQGNKFNTEGKLVQGKIIPLCDSTDYNGNPVSFEENWANAENQLKLVGIDTEEIDDEDIEELVPQLPNEDDYYFSFRTWKPKDSDRVVTTIEGPLEDYEEEEQDDEVEEAEEETEEEEAAPAKGKGGKGKGAAKSGGKSGAKRGGAKGKKKEEPEEESSSDDADLDTLIEEADGGDEDAQAKLAAQAEEYEIDYESEDYPDWTSVGEAVKAAMEEGEGEEEEGEEEEGEGEEEEVEEEEGPPAKGDVASYKPPRAKKSIDCEVTAVFPKKETCNVKNLKTGKVFKQVPWDKLEPIE